MIVRHFPSLSLKQESISNFGLLVQHRIFALRNYAWILHVYHGNTFQPCYISFFLLAIYSKVIQKSMINSASPLRTSLEITFPPYWQLSAELTVLVHNPIRTSLIFLLLQKRIRKVLSLNMGSIYSPYIVYVRCWVQNDFCESSIFSR